MFFLFASHTLRIAKDIVETLPQPSSNCDKKTHISGDFLWHFFRLVVHIKSNYMKSLLHKLSVVNEDTHEEFHLVGTIAVVFAMLTFIGSTFYLLLNTYS